MRTVKWAVTSSGLLNQLAALGYITTTVEEGTPTEGLPDPVTQLPMLKEVEKARSLLQSGDLVAAHAQVDSILETSPTFVDMRSLKAQLLFREGKLPEAYEAAVSLDKDHPSTNHKALIANILLRSGRALEASQTFRSIVDIDPYLKDAWGGLLTSLFLAGKVPQLDAAVQESKALHPSSLAVQTFDGIVKVMRGNTDEAEPVLLGVLDQNPNQPFVNHSLALVRRAQGDPNAAEQFLNEEIRLHPPAIPARRTLVEVLAEQRRYDDQLVQLNVIASQERPSALTMHSRAQALFNLGRIDEAATETTRCRETDPRYPGCWMLWANVLSKQGKRDDAQSAYQEALRLVDEVKTSRGQ